MTQPPIIGFDISFLQTQCKRHNLKQNEAQSACAESANKGVNKLSKDVTQTQQQRSESPTVTLTWRASKYKVHKFHQSYIHFGSVHVLLKGAGKRGLECCVVPTVNFGCVPTVNFGCVPTVNFGCLHENSQKQKYTALPRQLKFERWWDFHCHIFARSIFKF